MCVTATEYPKKRSVMKLTDRQINFFRTFGFLKFPGLFAEEAGAITDAFEKIWEERGATWSSGWPTTATWPS